MFKKITISAVVALPFPFLIFLAGSRLDVFTSEQSAIEFLKSDNGVAFYFAAFLLFVVSSVIASLFFDAEVRSTADDEFTEDEDSEGEGAHAGTVKWFNVNKGFGFITTESGDDIFVHFRSIKGRGRRSLRQGQSVRFDISVGEKGQQADNVSVAK